MHRIAYYALNVLVIVDGEGLVTGLEVEYLSVAAIPEATRTEYLTAGIVTDEKKLVGCGNGERLTVGFLMGKGEVTVDILGDGMTGLDNPERFRISRLAPGKVTGGTHKSAERL